MAYEIVFDKTRQLAVIRLSGYVDAGEIDAAAEAQTQHPDFEPGYNSLWDLRHTSAVDVSPEGMERLVQRKLERDEQLGLHGRIAIVVNRHTIAGAALLAKVRGSRQPGRVVDVFPSEKLALAWLDEG